MQQIAFFPSSEESRKNFYPTPIQMIDKMLAGVELKMFGSMLEPSAGKGDLALAYIRRRSSGYYDPDKCIEKTDVDCIEIDPDLRGILKEKKLRVVHDDFLTYSTVKKYDLILMNPPFDKGAEHVLKALAMQENGGAVITLLNAETILNPCTIARRILAQKIKEYEAQVEIVPNAFADAERRASVDVAVIRFVIPYGMHDQSTILDNLRKDTAAEKSNRASQANDPDALAKGDYLEAIIDSYKFEVQCGVRLIEEYHAVAPYLLKEIGEEKYNSQIIGLSGADNVNDLVKAMRKKYWRALFQKKEFTKNLTTNLQEELHSNVERLADYEFSHYNVMQLMVDMSKKVIKGVEDTIMELFEEWTRKYHWSEQSENIHYFNGWRTNDSFAVNKKVIIPMYGVWEWGNFDPTNYRVGRKLADIEKVFDYLSGRQTDGMIHYLLEDAKKMQKTSKIQLRYFHVTFYKKGTCHVVFTDLDVLQKFNLFAAKGKNWLPPSYGRKRYKDMNHEEKAVIDSFEGEESYQKVLDRPDYFLGSVMPAGLPAGK